MQLEEDLKYIPANLYSAELVYLQRKKFIDMNNSKVLISGKGIDVIDHIMDEYIEYLRITTDQESGYEYRHLSAWKILVIMTNRIFTPVTNNGNIKHS